MTDNPNASLLNEIEGFLAVSGMGPSYFGKVAANNSEIVRKLKEGKTVTLTTAERVRAFIRLKTAEAA